MESKDPGNLSPTMQHQGILTRVQAQGVQPCQEPQYSCGTAVPGCVLLVAKFN
jgi:hypothetical protein